MKRTTKNIFLFALSFVTLSLSMTGCKEYLTEPEPGVIKLEDFFTSKEAAVQTATGCYVPLMWEYQNTYCSEWFIGDIVSDDALKGGQSPSDMGAAYDMENWKTSASNPLLLDFYRAQYQGIGRCNLGLKYVAEMEVDTVFTPTIKNRLLGEMHFLRAYYYFRLVRVYGAVPLVTEVLDTEDKWIQSRTPVADVFNQIISDLQFAQKHLARKSEMDKEDMGRATKGAAEAMLQKTYLYMASPYWNTQLGGNAVDYAKQAKAWGDSVIASNEYQLVSETEYGNMFFEIDGENGVESVFEIQYAAVPWGDYNEGFGFTAGSFTQRLVRSRSTTLTDKDAGWGFNHPTQNLYDEFEAGDPRRDIAILNPTDAQIVNASQEIYLGSRYLNRKYGWYGHKLDHDSRGPLNNKQIRYADVLLMQAEACLISGEGDPTSYLNQVRARVGLPAYGSYSFAVNGTLIAAPTIEQAIRHERRMELAMEGHRWFDLVRWGGTKEHMEAYQATESKEAQEQMGKFVAGKHEIFPIPAEEIELNPMEQNPGYTN